jgi:hypothetical protein
VTHPGQTTNADRMSVRAAETVGPISPSQDTVMPGGYGYGPGELLGMVGGELLARGLEVNDLRFGGVLAAIEVTNPDDRERGTVCVGRDGYFYWERWAPLNGRDAADRAVDATVDVLSAQMEGGGQPGDAA